MGENKCLVHGTVLLHGGEDEAAGKIFLLCSCRVSRNNRTYSMITRSRHPLSRRFSFSQVSLVVMGTFPFAKKITRTYSLKT